MNYSSRFFLYAPLALFLALAAGTGVYWWIVAGALSDKLDALNGREAMPGVTVTFKSKTLSGFPFNLDVVFEDVTVTVKTPHGPSSWSTEKAALHGLTYGREQFIFEAAGRQSARWTDLDGRGHEMPFAVGNLHASTIAGERGLLRVDIDLADFGSPALTAGRVQLHARIAPNAKALEIFASADAVHLSPRLTSLFGPDIKQARIAATLTPPRPFDGLRAGRTDWVSALETWRMADGAANVDDIEISWERLSAKGKGRLALDGRHAVAGFLDFKVAGIETLIDAARQRGTFGGANNGLAAALLDRAAAAGSNEAGLTGAVVEFKDGIVALGGEPATTEEPLY